MWRPRRFGNLNNAWHSLNNQPDLGLLQRRGTLIVIIHRIRVIQTVREAIQSRLWLVFSFLSFQLFIMICIFSFNGLPDAPSSLVLDIHF